MYIHIKTLRKYNSTNKKVYWLTFLKDFNLRSKVFKGFISLSFGLTYSQRNSFFSLFSCPEQNSIISRQGRIQQFVYPPPPVGYENTLKPIDFIGPRGGLSPSNPPWIRLSGIMTFKNYWILIEFRTNNWDSQESHPFLIVK